MDPNSNETTTQYHPVTVDVPEERVAEFHAFFARFLAGRPSRGRRGRHGRPHHGAHGGGCAGRRKAPEGHEATGTSADIAEA
ncbi:MAG: hypothetical protein ACR2JH_00295 [Solirubrobacteraceae bacterium]